MLVAHEAQLSRVAEAGERHARRTDVIGLEESQASEERVALEARQQEAAASMPRSRSSSGWPTSGWPTCSAGWPSAATASPCWRRRSPSPARCMPAWSSAWPGLVAEMGRLEEAGRDLETESARDAASSTTTSAAARRWPQAIDEGKRAIDEEVRGLDRLRQQLVRRTRRPTHCGRRWTRRRPTIRTARGALDETRGSGGELDVAQAKADSDLGHMAQACVDALQLTLDAVLAEVEELEQAGQAVPDAAALAADEADADAEAEDG